MTNAKRALGALLLLSLLLSGCWDAKEIQYISYATAMGIDYDEAKDEYIAYAQILDFANVAKQAGTANTGSGSVWVGKGQGRTLQKAFMELYTTSQETIFWGNTTAIVYHERLLKGTTFRKRWT